MGSYLLSRMPSGISLVAALLLGTAAGGSVAHATDASDRGKSAQEWARGAVPGDSAVTVDADAVALPAETDAGLPDLISKTSPKAVDAVRAKVDAAINSFNAAHKSNFRASIDAASGRIKVLYGSQSRKYSNGPESAARSFLADAHQLLGLQESIADLKTSRVNKTAEKDHVRFQQTYKGVPVIGGSVIVHSGKDGQVTMVQNSYIEGVVPDNSDLLTEAVARGIALDDLKAGFNAGTALSEGKLEKQIIQMNGKRLYIWKVTISTKAPFCLWVYHVDAESGKILYKKNEITAFKTGKGSVFTSNANFLASKVSSAPLKNMYTPAELPDYWGYLMGRYAQVYNYNPATGGIKLDPYSSSYQFLYSPTSDQFHATQAYYAIDITRDWWLKNVVLKLGADYMLDSSNPFTWSTPLVVNVDYTDFCNAYYTPDWLGTGYPGMVFGNENMAACGFNNNDLVLDYDVVRHEYTHAMMDWAGFNDQFGGYVDWYGRAMGEGNADWFGYLQHPKDPKMASVAWANTSDGYLRNLNNTRMYPWDVNVPGYGLPEEHYTGEIWGGFLYDIYRVLGSSALKYVAQSFPYFNDSTGFQAYQPDFFDAILAMMKAEYDLTGKYTLSQKAWGAMTSRGINGLLQPEYSSSNYFNTGVSGKDNRYFWYYGFPSNKSISTSGNLLINDDTHEYVVRTYNGSMKMTATVTGAKNGLYNPVVSVYDWQGKLVASPVSSSNGTSVTLTAPGLSPTYYVVRVTGKTYTQGRGYYTFKVAIQ